MKEQLGYRNAPNIAGSIFRFALLSIFFISIGLRSGYAEVSLPGLIADNMVLQRDVSVKIWGWGNANEKVTVDFNHKTYQAQTATNGKWLIKLDPTAAGGPFTMDISGESNSIRLKNILFGEVWLCGGQSNMVLDFNNGGVKALYAKEIAESANDKIRQVIVNRTYGFLPAEHYKTNGWKSAGPATLGGFSAAAYFFALQLYKQYHVPIGLVNDCIGGTLAEAWTGEAGLQAFPQFSKDLLFLKDSATVLTKIQQTKNDAELWDKNVEMNDKGYDGQHQPIWADANFDDSQWATTPEPDFWDNHNHRNTFGTVWLRKEIDLPASWKGQDATLDLGQIDDIDVTFVNGVVVGKGANRDFKRNYTVPGKLLHEGKNVISIRITNISTTGGIFPDHQLQLSGKVGSISLNGDWKFEQGVNMPVKGGIYDPKNLPSSLYNGMIAPIASLEFKGVIWYQGEYNTHRAYEYRQLFPALIANWRATFGRGDFPFIFVQLPNFQPVVDHPTENEWAELREAQLMTLSVPNTAMAVTIDAGGLELHPADKKDVGDRLALAARKLAYSEQKLVASGPLYRSMKIDGDKIILTFDNSSSTMVSKDGQALRYFAIAGDDKKFVWAKAEILGNEVVVSSPEVTHPVAVRYAWAGNPSGCNLYNKADLPASPFRTDDWPGLTINNK